MRPPTHSLRRGAAVLLLSAAALAATACGSSSPTTIATPPGSVGFTPKAPGSSAPTDPAGTTPSTPGPTPGSTPGTTAPLGTPTLTGSSTISTVGLDKVHFGMTLAEAQQAAGSALDPVGTANPTCELVKPASGPEGVQFLVSDGRIERVDVSQPPIATRSGAKVGSTNAEVKALYGDQLQEQPRPDGQPGTALVFVPKDAEDAKFRLVFLTDGTTVQAYRAGRIPQVLLPTGCK